MLYAPDTQVICDAEKLRIDCSFGGGSKEMERRMLEGVALKTSLCLCLFHSVFFLLGVSVCMPFYIYVPVSICLSVSRFLRNSEYLRK